VIISLISYKGGVGKSSTCIHLAAVLARSAPTLAVDGDQNASLLDWQARGDGLPFEICHRDSLAKYASKYEHLVIDTAARPQPSVLKGIVAGCDRLILTTAVDGVSMAALRPAIDDLNALNAQYTILLNLVPPVGAAGETARNALRTQSIPVLDASVRRYVAVQRAGLLGSLVWDISDENSLISGSDYERLAAEITRA
jgi:chromosome partitioning protein